MKIPNFYRMKKAHQLIIYLYNNKNVKLNTFPKIAKKLEMYDGNLRKTTKRLKILEMVEISGAHKKQQIKLTKKGYEIAKNLSSLMSL